MMLPFRPPKRCVYSFWRKTQKSLFSSSFGFDSALKTIDAQMFFWSVFFENTQKSYWPSKTPFWPFWQLIMVFLWVFKNTDLNNICASIVFTVKLKQKKNMKKHFLWFLFQNSKLLLLGVNQFKKKLFFFSFSF